MNSTRPHKPSSQFEEELLDLKSPLGHPYDYRSERGTSQSCAPDEKEINVHQNCDDFRQSAGRMSAQPGQSSDALRTQTYPGRGSLAYPAGMVDAIRAGKVLETSIEEVLSGSVPETPKGAFFTLVMHNGSLVPVRVRIPGKKSMASKRPLFLQIGRFTTIRSEMSHSTTTGTRRTLRSENQTKYSRRRWTPSSKSAAKGS